MKLKDLKNKRILILGYGKEGKATEAFLKKAFPSILVDHTDKKMESAYLERQKEYDVVIKTPGIPKKFITVPYTTATNLFFESCPGVIIGVTGSKGKSTTSTLIYHILKSSGKPVHLVGNIGNPALLELMLPRGKDDIFVIELSSYQLDDIAYSPHISVMLNLFPEHMDYHGDVSTYFESKKNIIKQSKENDFFIYNPQYEDLVQLAKNTYCRAIPFTELIPLSDNKIPLLGEHNRTNIKAALTVVSLFDISEESIKKSLLTFKPLRHRLENIGTYREITFYDDAISTTPESTICAINSFPKIGTIFLGGFDRGYDFGKLSQVIIDQKIPNIVLFPDSGDTIFKLLKKVVGIKFRFLKTKSMEEAVVFAYENTPVNTVCLLSTASPSYSLWKNFEEKGDLFQFFVKKYQRLRVPGRFNKAVG